MKVQLEASDLTVEVLRGTDLNADHVAEWSAIQASDALLSNPFFCPEFTRAAAGARQDVFVAVIRRGTQVQGFFAFHRGWDGVGRPVGDWLSHLNGVVIPSGLQLDPRGLVRACGLRGWDFSFLPSSLEQFSACHRATQPFGYIDLSRGYEAYVAERTRSGTRLPGKVEALARKFEREVGPLKFEFMSPDPRALEALMQWSYDKYRWRGGVDIRRFPWAVDMIRNLHRRRAATFAGVLSVLTVNDDLVAAHMGMRSRTVLQCWLPGYNKTYARYCPGLILFMRIAREASNAGVERMDLGGGPYHYKARLASGHYLASEGTVGRAALSTSLSRIKGSAYAWIRKSPVLRPPARLIAREVDALRRACQRTRAPGGE